MPGETLLPNQTAPDAMLHEAITRAGAALARQQHADGHWVFELEADATIPAEYVLLEHFLDQIDPALEEKIAVYLRASRASTAAGRCSMAARSTSAHREGLFRAEDDRRRPGRAAHGAGARGDPGPRRGGAAQRLHAHPARPVRPAAVARGAGDAGRDHPAAALVPVPPVEGVLLVAHRDRAAAGPDGAAAAGAQSARRRDPGAVPHAAASRCATGSAARSVGAGGSSSSASTGAARGRAAFPERAASARSTRRCASSPSG